MRQRTLLTLAAATAFLPALARPVSAEPQNPAGQAPAAAVVSPAVAPVNGSVTLGRSIAAHGGLDRWRAQGTMAYTLTGFPLTPQLSKPNRSTIDLVARFNRIDGEGFTAAWDGQHAWITPAADAAGLPPRFFVRGSMYFLVMPFVFADAGITATDAGTATYGGVTYDLVRLGYADGVGDVNDEYELFFDRQTHRLAVINHSVKGANIDRVTWTFDQWQEVNGLLVPRVLSFSPGWNPQAPGEGKSVQVTDVRFEANRPAAALYAVKPAGAVVVD